MKGLSFVYTQPNLCQYNLLKPQANAWHAAALTSTPAPPRRDTRSTHLKHTTTLFALSGNGELLLIKYRQIIMVGLMLL